MREVTIFDAGVVTLEPTYTAEGVRIYTCIECGETKTESIPVREHQELDPLGPGNTETPPDGSSIPVQPGNTTDNPFTDVHADDYFLDPVLWALAHDPQITNGTTAEAFSPDDVCTRAQIVTFLYRDMK